MYSANAFKEILEKIQRAVDELSLNQYSNLHAWVAKLDEEVEAKLAVRLKAGIEEWTKALLGNLKVCNCLAIVDSEPVRTPTFCSVHNKEPNFKNKYLCPQLTD